MQRPILIALLTAAFAGFAVAANVAPCSPGAASENIIPVSDGAITYCVSDFGWSDTWLLGTPAAYNPLQDLFSGDDAFNLKFSSTGGIGSGLGWLSPSLDMGTLVAQPEISKWTVVTPVHSTGPNSAASLIAHPDGLQIAIATTALGPGVVIHLTITNTSSAPINDLQLADYFNFHPNGSSSPQNKDGTTSYHDNCIFTTGVPIDLADGFMCGSAAPNKFDVGLAYGPAAVWLDVQNNSYNGFAGPLGPDDTAGALEWNLGNLAPGASIGFTVAKNDPPSMGETPEPATGYAAFACLVALAGWSRSRRRNNH